MYHTLLQCQVRLGRCGGAFGNPGAPRGTPDLNGFFARALGERGPAAVIVPCMDWTTYFATGCTLFTDLANPVSNRIYERIGFRRVSACATVAW